MIKWIVSLIFFILTVRVNSDTAVTVEGRYKFLIKDIESEVVMTSELKNRSELIQDYFMGEFSQNNRKRTPKN